MVSEAVFPTSRGAKNDEQIAEEDNFSVAALVANKRIAITFEIHVRSKCSAGCARVDKEFPVVDKLS